MIRFTPQIEQLPRLMDVADLRHRVISQNLANVNTPGYQRLDVNFERQLADAIRQSPDTGAEDVEAEVFKDFSTSMRADGNNVDIDRELGAQGKNAMLFQIYSQLLRSQFDALRRAIEAP